ncbi:MULTISPECIES: type II secretion system protein N [Aliivibrio]|jgi:general secretion pathway protein N|uniref:Type II secretion system protein N n=2 Tax=Aliivibrio TaxID=511678 RepID=A0A1B9NV88_ALILO|nr:MULTISPECIES: type II secretion system protein N [Aliivibrio]AZL85984.1 type II secretion system protein N [Aliivibrio salmonicida]OCH18422.1 general secretion pathway protein GspN [Aliivibrio logei]CAQ80598.1 general secretion pathway protein N [Aliivibrio salmonicida LFI1238]
MKFKLLIATVFSTFFTFSALLHMPIQWVIDQAPKVNGLALTGLSGTPWKGQVDSLSWQRVNYGQVQWEIDPLAILKGHAEFAVRFGRGSELGLRGKGMVGYSVSKGAYAENVVASFPVANILNRLPMAVPVSLQGQAEITVKSFQQGQPWCKHAEGEVVWSGGKIVSPLGNIDPKTVIADTTCIESKLTVVSKQNSSDVSSEFNIVLNPNRSYQVNGWFKPESSFPSSFRSQLKWLGKPDAKGQYRVTYSGRL